MAGHGLSAGQEQGRRRDPAGLDGEPGVFDRGFFLLVKVAVGGTAPVPPDTPVTFPQTMLIDYIRLYEPAARRS